MFHAIASEVEAVAIPLDVLLGSHGREAQGGSATAGAGDWGTEGPADPAVVDAIRRIVEKWPPPEQPIRGRSLADLLKQMTVAPAPRVDPAVLAATRRALLGAADRGKKEARRVEGPRPALVPLPDPRDRRASVARSLGTTPLLYRSTLLDPRGRGDGATHVYLDVSGSMDPWLEDLYAALGTLRRHVASDVHLFSTRVETVPLRALLDGLRPTTGGTEIACALEHALAGRARRVLVVTDGYVGRAPRGPGPGGGATRARGPRAPDTERLAPRPRAHRRSHRRAAVAGRRAAGRREERMTERLRFAEAVCVGHPDRLADTIAERIVALAVARDPEALVGVEVALHRNVVFVDGRVAAGRGTTRRGRRGRDRGDRAAGLRRRRLRRDRRPASSRRTRRSSRCGPTSASARCRRTSGRSAT